MLWGAVVEREAPVIWEEVDEWEVVYFLEDEWEVVYFLEDEWEDVYFLEDRDAQLDVEMGPGLKVLNNHN